MAANENINIKGKIAENRVNVYIDCIDVIHKKGNITMIVLDVLKTILDLKQFIGEKINISNLLPESTIDGKSNIDYNKDIRSTESAKRLIDAEKMKTSIFKSKCVYLFFIDLLDQPYQGYFLSIALFIL